MNEKNIFNNIETIGTTAGVVSAVCGVIVALKKCYDTHNNHKKSSDTKKTK